MLTHNGKSNIQRKRCRGLRTWWVIGHGFVKTDSSLPCFEFACFLGWHGLSCSIQMAFGSRG